jgi:hypothetical protein
MKKKAPRRLNRNQILILIGLGIFLFHQTYIPIRHHFYPGDGKSHHYSKTKIPERA